MTVPARLLWLMAVVSACGGTATPGQRTKSSPPVAASSTLAAAESVRRAVAETVPPADSAVREVEAMDALVPDTGPTYVAHGACPFECCHYGEWRILTNASVRAAANLTSDSIGMILTGTAVRADSGVVIFQPTGLVMMLASAEIEEDSGRFEPGDSVELLEEKGEGVRSVRWRGRHLEANVDDWSSNSKRFRVLRRPYERWWVHMTVPHSGLHGWVQMEHVDVNGWDSCG